MVIASILLGKSRGSATPGRAVHQVLEVEVSVPQRAGLLRLFGTFGNAAVEMVGLLSIYVLWQHHS